VTRWPRKFLDEKLPHTQTGFSKLFAGIETPHIRAAFWTSLAESKIATCPNGDFKLSFYPFRHPFTSFLFARILGGVHLPIRRDPYLVHRP